MISGDSFQSSLADLMRHDIPDFGVFAVNATHMYTDGKSALLLQTRDIEIGGALTGDTQLK